MTVNAISEFEPVVQVFISIAHSIAFLRQLSLKACPTMLIIEN